MIRKLESRLHRFPTALEIQALSDAIAEHAFVAGLSRLRVYFYHAPPAGEVIRNPISKQSLALGATRIYSDHAQLLLELERTQDFALRLGETSVNGWKVGDRAFRRLTRTPRSLSAADLVPAIEQKGVDLRIGLDIARLALTHAVDVIVTVTADSDLVPAFKFARREGVRVFLCHLGHGIKRQLRAHADRTLRVDLPEALPQHCAHEEAA